jgi:hypothetical protein
MAEVEVPDKVCHPYRPGVAHVATSTGGRPRYESGAA